MPLKFGIGFFLYVAVEVEVARELGRDGLREGGGVPMYPAGLVLFVSILLNVS